MKRVGILLLRAILLPIGFGVFAFLLWEPHIEGRNVNATLFAIYFEDPFLAYSYIASIPFFAGLYQIFKALGYVGNSKGVSIETMASLRTIRFCAISVLGFVAVGEVFIFLSESDDRAGGVFMGILIAFASIVMAAAMTVFERKLQKALSIKLETDVAI